MFYLHKTIQIIMEEILEVAETQLYFEEHVNQSIPIILDIAIDQTRSTSLIDSEHD